MTPITTKICLVGDFAVGKTSVVEQFVHNQFSDKYLTTIGVKIDTKEIALVKLGVRIKLIIWDVAGSEELGRRELAYLRGASGIVFVADGTRAVTLESARNLRKQAQELYGGRPNILLLNKNDLTGMWQLDDAKTRSMQSEFCEVFSTSAKTGDGVEAALTALAELIIANDLV